MTTGLPVLATATQLHPEAACGGQPSYHSSPLGILLTAKSALPLQARHPHSHIP